MAPDASYSTMSTDKPSTKPSTPSFGKGAIAGLLGGLAGTCAKLASERLFPPRLDGHTPPTVALAEQVTHRPLEGPERQTAEQAVYFLFGALAGAVYGAVVEFEPSLGAWRGAAFGITLNRITHESVLPRLGLTVPPEERRTEERISEWVTHAVYGATTDAVRRAVRKRL